MCSTGNWLYVSARAAQGIGSNTSSGWLTQNLMLNYEREKRFSDGPAHEYTKALNRTKNSQPLHFLLKNVIGNKKITSGPWWRLGIIFSKHTKRNNEKSDRGRPDIDSQKVNVPDSWNKLFFCVELGPGIIGLKPVKITRTRLFNFWH